MTNFKKISPSEIQKTLLDDLTKEEIEKVKRQIINIEQKPIYLTTKIKISPTEEQKEILWILAENCRLIYNFALEERKLWWEKNKDKPKEQRESNPSYISQQNQLPALKRKFPRYQQNYSKTLQCTLKQLQANYKSYLTKLNNGDKTAQPPGYKGKKHFAPLIYNQSGFKFNEKTVTFSHYYPTKNSQEVELSYQLDSKINFHDKEIKQITISQNHKTKEFFLSLTYKEGTTYYQDNNIYQAIDLGVMNIVASVNSHAGKSLIIKNNRVDKYWQSKIEEVQSKRDKCLKFSNRWFWYNTKLQKMKRKQTNQQKDFQHKLSRKIIENTKANTIIIGDLNVKEMSKKSNKKNDKSLNRTTQNTGCLSRFAGFLTYKAELVGKKVIRISERRTTKRCCYCMKKKIRTLSERIIHCDFCGLVIDRDINGACNIMQRFLAIISLSHKRLVVGQRLLKNFRLLFFAINSQTSNVGFSSNGVVRTRKKSLQR